MSALEQGMLAEILVGSMFLAGWWCGLDSISPLIAFDSGKDLQCLDTSNIFRKTKRFQQRSAAGTWLSTHLGFGTSDDMVKHKLWSEHMIVHCRCKAGHFALRLMQTTTASKAVELTASIYWFQSSKAFFDRTLKNPICLMKLTQRHTHSNLSMQRLISACPANTTASSHTPASTSSSALSSRAACESENQILSYYQRTKNREAHLYDQLKSFLEKEFSSPFMKERGCHQLSPLLEEEGVHQLSPMQKDTYRGLIIDLRTWVEFLEPLKNGFFDLVRFAGFPALVFAQYELERFLQIINKKLLLQPWTDWVLELQEAVLLEKLGMMVSGKSFMVACISLVNELVRTVTVADLLNRSNTKCSSGAVFSYKFWSMLAQLDPQNNHIYWYKTSPFPAWIFMYDEAYLLQKEEEFFSRYPYLEAGFPKSHFSHKRALELGQCPTFSTLQEEAAYYLTRWICKNKDLKELVDKVLAYPNLDWFPVERNVVQQALIASRRMHNWDSCMQSQLSEHLI